MVKFIILETIDNIVMTTKEDRLRFLAEMGDAKRIKRPNKADVVVPRELTPGHIERQRAAIALPLKDTNPLTADMVEPLTAQDVLSWKRSGVQNGVFRKLRLGYYPSEAKLDLHGMTVDEARRQVFGFVNDCMRYDLRTAMILHGKGERNRDGIAWLKSYLAKWLPELEPVLAFHTAQKHHGSTGAIYLMIRKSDREKHYNREVHDRRD